MFFICFDGYFQHIFNWNMFFSCFDGYFQLILKLSMLIIKFFPWTTSDFLSIWSFARAVLSITVFWNGQVTSLPAIREWIENQCGCLLPILMANIAAVNCISIQLLLDHKLKKNYSLLSFEEKLWRIIDDSAIFLVCTRIKFCRLFSAMTSCFVLQ